MPPSPQLSVRISTGSREFRGCALGWKEKSEQTFFSAADIDLHSCPNCWETAIGEVPASRCSWKRDLTNRMYPLASRVGGRSSGATTQEAPYLTFPDTFTESEYAQAGFFSFTGLGSLVALGVLGAFAFLPASSVKARCAGTRRGRERRRDEGASRRRRVSMVGGGRKK